MEKDLKYCVKELRDKIPELIKSSKENGVDITVICTARSEKEQLAFYAQGRYCLYNVNELRKEIGLSPIREQENNHNVTWTLDSKHVIGNKRVEAEAIDFVVLKNGKVDWNDIKSYKIVADIAETLGLKAGYYFKKTDPGHIEIRETA